MTIRSFFWLLPLLVLGLAACDSVLDTNPTSSIDADDALETADDAQAAVTGAYSVLQSGEIYGQSYVVIPDLYADNLDHTGTFSNFAEVDNNNVFPDNVSMNGVWTDVYNGIKRTNAVLAGLDDVEVIDQATYDRLKGEALFLRALYHFDLARYFGPIPVVTTLTTDATEIERPERDDLDAVYTQVVADLTEAASLLPPSNQAGRATSGAATALLARVYLDQGQYQAAADAATAVIESPAYGLVDDYSAIFQAQNTQESIFEVQFSVNDPNSHAFWLFPSSLGGRQEYAPSADLCASYEADDERFAATVSGDCGYGVKYFRVANGDDNVPVLRLAEMYLIRAEANAQLDAAADVVLADVNEVRNRAGLGDAEAATKAELLDVILQERRVEFALEGHRFFDLRRLGRAVSVLDLDSSDKLLFPIPQAERDVNPNLGQNSGY